jgi:RNA polymerase primary sigma factor
MRIPLGKVHMLLDASREPLSLDAPAGDSEETPFGQLVENKAAGTPEDGVMREDVARQVERAMAAPVASRAGGAALALRARHGSRLHAGRDWRRLSVTRERVRQIEARALAKLRAA